MRFIIAEEGYLFIYFFVEDFYNEISITDICFQMLNLKYIKLIEPNNNIRGLKTMSRQ